MRQIHIPLVTFKMILSFKVQINCSYTRPKKEQTRLTKFTSKTVLV